MSIAWLLFGFGTFLGISYWVLGIAASTHMQDKGIPKTERVLSATLLWSLTPASYDQRGKRYCVWGNLVMCLAIAAWIGWVKFQG